MDTAREGDHARADLGQEQAGEREVSEEVGADLHLEAVGRTSLWHGHHSGVVHQDIDRAAVGGKGAH
jgi:hypothetical protein